jgi:hypothetical protein
VLYKVPSNESLKTSRAVASVTVRPAVETPLTPAHTSSSPILIGQRGSKFLTGPRQSGKTTLISDLLGRFPALYLNWDDPDFFVTGSAKLDVYKKGQDSMLGRFFSWRLHPLCLAELTHVFKNNVTENLDKLLKLGRFPEPFFEKSEIFAKRWRKEKLNLVFRQDIMELESIKDISLLEIFYQALTERVSSEIVLSNIARDLEIAPKTAKSWLNLLEKTYSLFIVRPFSKGVSKAITKTPKVYLYDKAEVVGDEGARFENLVATHLLKRIQFLEDLYGDKYELNYLRDKTGHEIDFIILKNHQPHALIEVKLSDSGRSKSFYYFKERLRVNSCIQLVKSSQKISTKDGITVVSARDWLSRPLESEI